MNFSMYLAARYRRFFFIFETMLVFSDKIQRVMGHGVHRLCMEVLICSTAPGAVGYVRPQQQLQPIGTCQIFNRWDISIVPPVSNPGTRHEKCPYAPSGCGTTGAGAGNGWRASSATGVAVAVDAMIFMFFGATFGVPN